MAIIMRELLFSVSHALLLISLRLPDERQLLFQKNECVKY